MLVSMSGPLYICLLTFAHIGRRMHKGITYDLVETAFVGFCYGDSTSGQVSFLSCDSPAYIFTTFIVARVVQPWNDWNPDHECEQ